MDVDGDVGVVGLDGVANLLGLLAVFALVASGESLYAVAVDLDATPYHLTASVYRHTVVGGVVVLVPVRRLILSPMG